MMYLIAAQCRDKIANGSPSPGVAAYPNEVTVVCYKLTETSLATDRYQAQCQMDGTWLHYDACMSMGYSFNLSILLVTQWVMKFMGHLSESFAPTCMNINKYIYFVYVIKYIS